MSPWEALGLALFIAGTFLLGYFLGRRERR